MPQLISTQNPLSSTRPLTVGVIADEAALTCWEAFSPEERDSACDLIELRLDTLSLDSSHLRERLTALAAPHPMLFTARHPAEGGKGSAEAAGRMALLRPYLDVAQLIDVELRSAVEMKPIIEEAHAKGVKVLGSFHDFQATPGEDVLRGALDFAQPLGLDAVKIATYLNSSADLTRLMALTCEPQRLRLSAMGMGPWGRVSRLVLAKAGSLLNYGSIGVANAPGQWPAARLKQLLAEI